MSRVAVGSFDHLILVDSAFHHYLVVNNESRNERRDVLNAAWELDASWGLSPKIAIYSVRIESSLDCPG
jgi:hypothetical protein